MSAVLPPPMFESPGELPDVPTGLSPRLRAGLIAGGVALLLLAVWGVRHLMHDAPPAARQVAKIAILPDTPPPPPPPKQERKEEPPKSEPRPQPQPENIPKPETPPQAEPLKMEGPAGNGPSAFGAGSISKDYAGGAPTIGGSGNAGPAVDRAQERLWANSVRQTLRDELERQLSADVGELGTQLALWVGADGRITRWELQGTTHHEAELQAAMKRVAEATRLPEPRNLAQPVRFRLSLRSSG